MKVRIFVVFAIIFLLGSMGGSPVWAMMHVQRDGLFSMDIPASWHWAEYAQEVIIAYPDGQTVAIDIQFVPSDNMSETQIRQTLKDNSDKMVEAIKAHHAVLIDHKEVRIGGVYATQLDFQTPNTMLVTNISFFNKNHAFTITYGSTDDKLRSTMDDAVATIKF